MPTIPHWLWGAWAGGIVLLLVWFGVMEGIAIANRKGTADTLSEVVWQHGHIPAAVFFIGAGIMVFATIWLMIHFISRGHWGI